MKSIRISSPVHHNSMNSKTLAIWLLVSELLALARICAVL